MPILFLPVATNIATNALPASWAPYLWLAWPAAIVLTIPIGWSEVRRQRIANDDPDPSAVLPARLSGEERRRLEGEHAEPDEAAAAVTREIEDGGRLPALVQALLSDRRNRTPSIRIVLWGARNAGKTVYLSALPLASINGSSASGSCTVVGVDAATRRFALRGLEILTQGSLLPKTSATSRLTFRLHQPPPRRNRRYRGRGRDVVMELKDIPGEYFIGADDRSGREILYDLETSHGLMFLYDPLNSANFHNFRFFYETVLALASRLSNSGRLERGRLPHSLAVCVTKVDSPEVFSLAHEKGLVTLPANTWRSPEITSENAATLFDLLCNNASTSDADLIRKAIASFFREDRVEYFAISSLGFHLQQDGTFDPSDPSNVVMYHLRGNVRPVGVLQPLAQLANRTQRSGWAWPGRGSRRVGVAPGGRS